MNCKERLKEYINKDKIYQDYKQNKLINFSDFDKFCIQHCKDIEELLEENLELEQALDENNKLKIQISARETLCEEYEQLINAILNFSFFKEECPLNFNFEDNSKEDKAQNTFYNDEYCENNCNDNYKDCWLKYFKELQKAKGDGIMELWVRSQDRTFLRKVNTIGIVEGRDFWSIDENLTVSFGKYKTKERAIEVLDEIQNILKPKIVIKFDNKPKYLEDGTINDVLTPREEIDYSEQLSTYVYEMPEK